MPETSRIESVENPKVKDAVRLRERRTREKTGRFLVEGAREILRALGAGLRPVTLFVDPAVVASSDAGSRALEAARATGVRPFELSRAAFAKIAMREERDGIVAVFPIPDVAPECLRLGPAPLVLCVAGVEKPGNLGAVLRSADAFGVDALAVEGGADLILVKSNPMDIVRIIRLSAAAHRKQIQNIWWAAGYNVFAIPLAAGVLAAQGILLPPAFAAVLMSASTVIVALNAQLLRRAEL